MAGLVDGKVAIVTGAAGGIGRASAVAFAREGAKVVVADIAIEGGEATVAAIEAAGGEAIFVPTNITEPEQVENLLRRAVETFGRVDCAHNNAGVEGEAVRTGEASLERWQQVININLTGVFICMRHEIPQMLEQGGGAIVNTASVAGLVGFKGLPAYVASKHGVVGLTKTAALDYATKNIRINAVCPGIIDTAMMSRLSEGDEETKTSFGRWQPMNRLGTAEEVAAAVVWLCSEQASLVTGHAMAVDGGYISR